MEEVSRVVVDDHPLFRQGVADMLSLEPDFEIVGQAENGADALKLIRALRPGVAVERTQAVAYALKRGWVKLHDEYF
jgi:chemotaxis response regulator CheB